MFVDYGQQIIPSWLLLSARYVLLFETSYGLSNVRAVFDADNRDEPVPKWQGGAPEHTRLAALAFTAISKLIDLLDNYRYRGHEARLVVAFAAPFLGSERNFAWFYASTTHHINLIGDFG